MSHKQPFVERNRRNLGIGGIVQCIQGTKFGQLSVQGHLVHVRFQEPSLYLGRTVKQMKIWALGVNVQCVQGTLTVKCSRSV